MDPLALWLPLLAILLHLGEEFVWPGGFVEWYRRYPPGFRADVSTRFIMIINAVFVAFALTPPLDGPSPRAWASWLVLACIAGVNGLFHIVATIRGRSYAPGVITGALLYLPLALIGGAYLLGHRLVSPGTAIEAVVIAGIYQAWSSWKHRRAAVPA